MVAIGPYNIELVPSTSWGKSLAKLACTKGTGFRALWDKIRDRELNRAGHKCEICGASGRLLECHEKWYYDEATLTQKLVGYEVVCRDCSNVLHMGRASTKNELWQAAIAHFGKVTGLEEKNFKRAWGEAMNVWTKRSQHTWHIDISYEPLARGFEGKINELEWVERERKS